MPNRSYYLEQSAAMARHRKSYTSMIHNIMVLCGRSDKEAAADAANVMVLETAMARAMKPDDEERDEHGKRITVEDMSKLMPTVDWPLFLRNINLPHVGSQSQHGVFGVHEPPPGRPQRRRRALEANLTGVHDRLRAGRRGGVRGNAEVEATVEPLDQRRRQAFA